MNVDCGQYHDVINNESFLQHIGFVNTLHNVYGTPASLTALFLGHQK